MRRTDEFSFDVNLGCIFKGSPVAVQAMLADLSKLCDSRGVRLIFKTSGSKLWIKEGEGP